ncbi:MAG: alpha/beta hydrolase [Azoarcus sp.]|nr:alpha/beta hydrolase [Azoarcus sp.]
MKLRHTQPGLLAHGAWLPARLAHAPDVRGLALLLQSPPGRAGDETVMAGALQRAGYATLALDLPDAREEAREPDSRYNIAHLTERLLAILEWIENQPELSPLPLGALASGAASAAAVRAAARAPGRFGALCIFAGRPDLAGMAPLRTLRTPTCFIVDQNEPRAPILRQAFALIAATCVWREIDGGDPGQATEARLVAGMDIAAAWMDAHLPARIGGGAEASPPLAPRSSAPSVFPPSSEE